MVPLMFSIEGALSILKVKVLPIVAANMFVVEVVAAVGRYHYWLCTVVVTAAVSMGLVRRLRRCADL